MTNATHDAQRALADTAAAITQRTGQVTVEVQGRRKDLTSRAMRAAGLTMAAAALQYQPTANADTLRDAQTQIRILQKAERLAGRAERLASGDGYRGGTLSSIDRALGLIRSADRLRHDQGRLSERRADRQESKRSSALPAQTDGPPPRSVAPKSRGVAGVPDRGTEEAQATRDLLTKAMGSKRRKGPR